MADLLKRAVDWLKAQRRAYMAISVVYSRGTTSLAVSATLGIAEYESFGDVGQTQVTVHEIDFLIDSADLVGTFGEPQIGDRIVYSGQTFEVLDLADSGHYRRSDPYGVTLRLHTKMVKGS